MLTSEESECLAARQASERIALNVQHADEKLNALIEDYRLDISRGIKSTTALLCVVRGGLDEDSADSLRLMLALAVQRLARD